jgi:hypothetical protein
LLGVGFAFRFCCRTGLNNLGNAILADWFNIPHFNANVDLPTCNLPSVMDGPMNQPATVIDGSKVTLFRVCFVTAWQVIEQDGLSGDV